MREKVQSAPALTYRCELLALIAPSETSAIRIAPSAACPLAMVRLPLASVGLFQNKSLSSSLVINCGGELFVTATPPPPPRPRSVVRFPEFVDPNNHFIGLSAVCGVGEGSIGTLNA